MLDAFEHVCDFVCIYIVEAHAVDEWPIRTRPDLCIKQQSKLQERCSVAKQLKNTHGLRIPLFVDTMDNTFETTYAAWPLRAFVFQQNKIQFILQPKSPGYYDLRDLYAYLENNF